MQHGHFVLSILTLRGVCLGWKAPCNPDSQGLCLRSLLRSFVLYHIMMHFGKKKTISAVCAVRLGRKACNREREQEGQNHSPHRVTEEQNLRIAVMESIPE